MNKSLAKTLTTALVQFIDRERPEGTMCCSDVECIALEQAITDNSFKLVEEFIKWKLSRQSDFEKTLTELVKDVLVKEPQNPSVWIVGSGWADKLLNLAREQFIKDGYVIEKKAFHDAVEKVDPEVMKEVSENVDKENEEKLTEFEKKVADIIDLWHEDYVQWSTPGASAHNYPDQIKSDAAELLALAKKEILKDGWHKVFSEEIKTACTNKYPSLSDFDKFLDSSNN